MNFYNRRGQEKLITFLALFIMQMMGLEPTRALAHMTLNHACLPIPTHLRESKNYSPTNKSMPTL